MSNHCTILIFVVGTSSSVWSMANVSMNRWGIILFWHKKCSVFTFKALEDSNFVSIKTNFWLSSFSYRCDSYYDCSDFSDESNCGKFSILSPTICTINIKTWTRCLWMAHCTFFMNAFIDIFVNSFFAMFFVVVFQFLIMFYQRFFGNSTIFQKYLPDCLHLHMIRRSSTYHPLHLLFQEKKLIFHPIFLFLFRFVFIFKQKIESAAYHSFGAKTVSA